MADVIAEISKEAVNLHVPKKSRSRKALNPKSSSTSEANILAGNRSSQISSSPFPSSEDAGKENRDGLSLLLSPKKTKAASKKKDSKRSDVNELQQVQEKLEHIRLEKEKTEKLLKERDETLKRKEEELENRGKEQERLQLELKKLQKLKEFKPTMDFPFAQSLREKEEKKKKKGGPEIKKPSPPYILWCKDQWNEAKNKNPDAEFKEISNILGAKWKNLSPEEKKPYEEKYHADKESYSQIMVKEKREKEAIKLLEQVQKQKSAMQLLEQYLQFKQEADKESTKTRKEKDPLKPKKPMSAYFLFSNERRPVLVAENKNVLEIAKITGEEWRSMTNEMRAPYEEIAKKQKEDYLREMEVYMQKKNEEAANLQRKEEELRKVQKQEALQLLKKKEKTDNIIKKTKEKKKKQKEQRNVGPNKPRKPASSFLLFSRELRKELLQERPDINNSTLTTTISVKWKELAEAERQVWKDKAAEAMAEYKKEVEEYNKSIAMDNNNPQQ